MRRFVLILCVILAVPSYAIEPDEILPDPEQESRARALSLELRCLVCQNQSIDDSDAPLAQDLRGLVRAQIVAGKSDDEIRAFVTARYGDFVLLRPPVKPTTWPLWGAPFILFLLALWVARSVFSDNEGQEQKQGKDA